MSDKFDNFLNELAGAADKKKKGELGFKVYSGTDLRLASHVPWGIPTRIPQLDLELGRPGYPGGRTVELYGFEHSGKSCAALAAMAACQRKGGTCVWIDTEFAWDPDWARMNGVDPAQVAVPEVHTVEAIFNVQDKVIKAHTKTGDGTPLITVVDSVTAVPSGESEKKEYGEVQKIGTDARAIRNGMRKIAIDIAENNILAIYINHLTAKTNAVSFGAQSQSAGGHALKYWSSVRIKFSNMGNVMVGEDDNKRRRGMKVGLTVEKNKVAATGNPKVEAQLLENGFDLHENLFEGFVKIGEMERVNAQTWFFKPGDLQLSKKEWKVYVDDRSDGIDEVYDWFIKKAIEEGYIRSYQ
jgi:recombination protein RecA